MVVEGKGMVVRDRVVKRVVRREGVAALEAATAGG